MVKDRTEKQNGKQHSGDSRQEIQPRQLGEMFNGTVVNDAMKETQAFCGHEETEDILEDRLWRYAEGQMDEETQSVFWEKIKDCIYCLSKLTRMVRSLESVESESGWSADRLNAGIQKRKRRDVLARLSKSLKEVRSYIPEYFDAQFEQVIDGLKAKIEASFTYPVPRFSPVYGKSRLLSFSPFGKVRYPIVFEWQPENRATEYVISINDAEWLKQTTQNKAIMVAGTCDLSPGVEYMWELAVFAKDEIIAEESGFIEVATEADIEDLERIENTLQHISDDFEKAIIFAGILEQKGFYTEAIFNYSLAYEQDPIPSIAYRIASCYDLLEVKELSVRWNRKIPLEDAGE